MQQLVWCDASTTTYVLVKTLLVLQVGQGRKFLQYPRQAWAKVLLSVCMDFLFLILSDKGRREKLVFLLSSGIFSSCFTGNWLWVQAVCEKRSISVSNCSILQMVLMQSFGLWEPWVNTAKAKSSSSRANSSSRIGNTESRSSIILLFIVATEKFTEEIANAES